MAGKIESGEWPDFPAAFEKYTGEFLSVPEMSNVSIYSNNYSTVGFVDLGVQFDYASAQKIWIDFSLKVNTLTGADEITGIRRVREVNILTGATRVFSETDGTVLGKRILNSTKFQRAAKSQAMARKAGNPMSSQHPQHTDSPFQQAARRRQARPFRHQVEWDFHARRLICACLEAGKLWCPGIKHLIEDGNDVVLVGQAVEHCRKEGSFSVDIPVMPRAQMTLKFSKHIENDPRQEGVYTEDFLIKFTDDVRVWWEPGASMRALVGESFSILHESDEFFLWKSRCASAERLIRTDGTRQLLKVPCRGKYHGTNDDNLFNTMVEERIEIGPAENNKNLVYLATLYAWYDLFYGKCYSCTKNFDPANDVPQL